jgi:hypothetical protein
MLSHMRTTLDLPDPLFRQAKKLARDRKVPFRALVAEALRRVLKEEAPRRKFKLPDRSFGQGGLVGGLTWADWDRIRDLVYEGRGA